MVNYWIVVTDANRAKKEKEKEQRRTLILNAAQTLFFTKNYDEITIEEIAEKTQLKKAPYTRISKAKERCTQPSH